ncbi:MAG TPA: 6,7-dimethyl-8-ribityllumazine synthase [Pirellulaceae bacterium]|nr:6,7-dimethyl-8-ribityllumazine synthase [Pirellulaceae bacterium]
MTHGATNIQREALQLAPDARVALVVSNYHHEITHALRDAARDSLLSHGLAHERLDLFETPGAWEIPLACQWVLDLNRHAGVIALGAVIRGETSHDQYINRFVSSALGQLALDSGIPVAFGLLTCETLEQARARCGGDHGNKGREAAEALLSMLSLKRQLDEASAV